MEDIFLYPGTMLHKKENSVKDRGNILDFASHRAGDDGFHKAFASLDRINGPCRLTLIWRKNKRPRNWEAHHFLLIFNHEGIKEYWTEEISPQGLWSYENRLGFKALELDFAEALSLLQDAYLQNIRFKTKIAGGLNEKQILAMQSLAVDESIRTQVNLHILPAELDECRLTNIYLMALKRLDLSLVYDLSTPQRQKVLGDRFTYLLHGEREFEAATFLRTRIISVEKTEDIFLAEATVIFSNAVEEIVRHHYQIQLLKGENGYRVHDIQLLKREVLDPAHPDNPLYYKVYAYLYKHKSKEKLRKWFSFQASIFLSGELASWELYKWLKGGSEPWEEYDFSRAISAEFYLSDAELLVFSRYPENLAGISRLMSEDLPGQLELEDQYYLDNSVLLEKILYCEGRTCTLSSLLKSKRAKSHILILDAREQKRFTAEVLQLSRKTVRLEKNFNYYLLEKNNMLAELYSAGTWQKVTIYNGYWEEELCKLTQRYRFVDVISDHEIEGYFDLFTPPLTEKRKWEIFKRLQLLEKEAGMIRAMGLVPSVKNAAYQLGVVI